MRVLFGWHVFVIVVLIDSYYLSFFYYVLGKVHINLMAGGGKQDMFKRTDRQGPHRAQFEKNKKRLLKSGNVCGICGKPIDMSLKAPHPMSPCIDHIIPVSKGGHPSDIDNLQLAHWTCNRQKSDKLVKGGTNKKATISNRNLAWSCDWTQYKGG